MNIAAYMEPGKTYSPTIATPVESSEDSGNSGDSSTNNGDSGNSGGTDSGNGDSGNDSSNLGGSSGGCESGFGLWALAAVMAALLKRR